jgi:DNA polymerase III alpha subunit
MSFVHLHLHTEFSLVDSVVRIETDGDAAVGLMDAVARAGMPAVALTDQGNLFAMVKFFKAAQSAGVKPVIGVDLLVHEQGERVEPSRLVLLCQNDVGYRNLTRLVSRSYLEGSAQGASDDRTQLAHAGEPARADRSLRRARRRCRARHPRRPRRRCARCARKLVDAVRRSLLPGVAAHGP